MRRLSWLMVAVVSVGCGSDTKRTFHSVGNSVGGAARAPEVRKDRGGEQAAPPAVKQADNKPLPRKIIYNGRVELVVEEFDAASAKLLELLAEHDGYLAKSDVTGRPGEPRRGHWTLRIPVARFDDFRKSLSQLGELRKSTLESDDITDRYFDMAAETTNLEAREKALRKLYEEKIAGSKLSDLLEVDRELTSVRGQINQRKGQLQRWDKETEFATLQVEMQDRKSYVPPTSPDYGTRLSRTFWGSVDALVNAGKGLVLAIVALSPWLAVLVVIAVPVVFLVRRRRTSPPPVPPTA